MKNYSFGLYKGANEISAEVLSLFVDENGMPITTTDYAYEIITSALDGRINLNRHFNFKGFEVSVERNNNRSDYALKTKKEISYVSEEPKEDQRESGVVYDSDLYKTYAERADEAFNVLLDTDEFEHAIENIKNLKTSLYVEENIDILALLQDALQGVLSAVNKIKTLCEKYPDLAENLQIILQSDREDTQQLLFA